jgi:hypothetical protein
MNNIKYNTGIYQIVNKINGKRYIGSAVDLRKRKLQHLYHLRNNKHVNKHLQKSYNKYGEKFFKFEIILYCINKDLIFFEQRAIDLYNFKKLYNMSPTAGSLLGIKQSLETINKRRISIIASMKKPESIEKRSMQRIGFKHTPESINKMSKSHMGRKLSLDHKTKISNAHKGKKKSVEHAFNIKKSKLGCLNPNFRYFTNRQINEMIKMRKNGKSYEKISKKFKCAHSTIILKLNKYLSK